MRDFVAARSLARSALHFGPLLPLCSHFVVEKCTESGYYENLRAFLPYTIGELRQ
jgi:hypothetical protein